jgi:hypothetical protein
LIAGPAGGIELVSREGGHAPDVCLGIASQFQPVAPLAQFNQFLGWTVPNRLIDQAVNRRSILAAVLSHDARGFAAECSVGHAIEARGKMLGDCGLARAGIAEQAEDLLRRVTQPLPHGNKCAVLVK